MKKSKETQDSNSFDESYPFGRMLDGIPRPSGPVLTLKKTLQEIFGFPEVYMTCVYRWLVWPIVYYISDKAIEIGKRLGKNTLIVPLDGCEEQYWTNTFRIIEETGLRFRQHIEVDDNRVYWLVSSCEPRSLIEADKPFLLYDISELTGIEFIGFFSHLLDCFNVNELSNNDQLSAGRILLDSRQLTKEQVDIVEKILRKLSEIMLVLDKLSVQYCGFQWPIENHIEAMSSQIKADEKKYSRITRIKDNFIKLKAQESDVADEKDVTINVKEGKVSIFNQQGQQVMYQYNAAGNINFSAVQNRMDVIAELEKLKEEFPKAAQAQIIDEDDATDAEYHLTKAIQQAKKPQPDKKTILEYIQNAKTVIESVSAASGLVTGLLTAIELVQKLF